MLCACRPTANNRFANWIASNAPGICHIDMKSKLTIVMNVHNLTCVSQPMTFKFQRIESLAFAHHMSLARAKIGLLFGFVAARVIRLWIRSHPADKWLFNYRSHFVAAARSNFDGSKSDGTHNAFGECAKLVCFSQKKKYMLSRPSVPLCVFCVAWRTIMRHMENFFVHPKRLQPPPPFLCIMSIPIN